MDEVKVRERIKTLILDNCYPAYIKVPANEKSLLYALCVNPNEMDWLYQTSLLDMIMRYVISDMDADAILLAKEVKNALSDYYESNLESMFEDCLEALEQDRREGDRWIKHVDPINGEITWSK